MSGEKPVQEVETENSQPEEAVAETTVADENVQSELLKKFDEVQAQVQEHRDRFLRAAAEHENFRKRMVRDKEQLRKYGAALLLEDLLPMLDSLAIGLESASKHPEAKPVTDGFAMVFNQLQSVLKEHGVSEIDPQGEVFDPNLHEGVAHHPSEEVEEGKIIAVTRKGYKLHDRLLRAAAVVVSCGASAPGESSS